MNGNCCGIADCPCDDGTNTTPPSEEVTLRLAYLDDRGREQYAVHRTTMSAGELRRRMGDVKLALHTCYNMLGYELLTIQAHFERTQLLAGERAAPRIKLLDGGYKGPDRRSGDDRRRPWLSVVGSTLALLGTLGAVTPCSAALPCHTREQLALPGRGLESPVRHG